MDSIAKSVHAAVLIRRRHEQEVLLSCSTDDPTLGAVSCIDIPWKYCASLEELVVEHLQKLGLKAVPDDLEWCGVITRVLGQSTTEVNIFELESWTGELVQSDNPTLAWFKHSAIPLERMDWADCSLWMPQLLTGDLARPFCGHFRYGDVADASGKAKLTDHAISQLPAPSPCSGGCPAAPGAALIVSTVSFKQAPGECARPLESFVRYHLRKGFTRIMFFIDDPSDTAALAAVSKFPRSHVLVRVRGPALLKEQEEKCTAASFAKFSPLMGTDVSARQLMDAELAMILAPELGCSWVVCLDSDELFYTSEPSVVPHFERLVSDGVYQMTYLNHEGVPEVEETEDYFGSITLFRRHHFSVPLSGKARDGLRFWMDRSERGQYMLFYDNGKSACRSGVSARPRSQHLWDLPDRQLSCTAMADPRNLNIDGYRACNEPCILHFPICGLSWFLAKYATLGNFSDTWLGDVRMPECFHSDARDLHAAGNGKLAAKFRKEVLLDDADEIQRQLDSCTCLRVSGHAELLDSVPRAAPNHEKLGVEKPKVVKARAKESFAPLDEGPKGIERGWILSKTMGYL